MYHVKSFNICACVCACVYFLKYSSKIQEVFFLPIFEPPKCSVYFFSLLLQEELCNLMFPFFSFFPFPLNKVNFRVFWFLKNMYLVFHSLFNLSSTEGHLGSSQTCFIVNIAALSICVYVSFPFVWLYLYIKFLGKELLNQRVF